VITWQDGREIAFSNSQLRHVDHAYAHTSYREQGVTTQHEIFLVSPTGAKVLHREGSYVSITRAKRNTEIVTTPARETPTPQIDYEAAAATAVAYYADAAAKKQACLASVQTTGDKGRHDTQNGPAGSRENDQACEGK
jgi:hypothetical protein